MSLEGPRTTTKRDEIKAAALDILKENRNGVRYSELLQKIHEKLPHIPINTVHGTIWNLEERLPSDVYRPAKGFLRHTQFREKDVEIERPSVPTAEKTEEADFYEPFAEWVKNELEECTRAISLGGNRFRDKWGTPDVIGILQARESDLVKVPTEIIAAEIKTNTGNLITAFGQACSYKLLGHKSYIVVPQDSPEEDLGRLDALCTTLGIGLILFDRKNPRNPMFQIRVRAAKHEPDPFYVNMYMKKVEEQLFS